MLYSVSQGIFRLNDCRSGQGAGPSRPRPDLRRRPADHRDPLLRRDSRDQQSEN
jgi:hypothetical protein